MPMDQPDKEPGQSSLVNPLPPSLKLPGSQCLITLKELGVELDSHTPRSSPEQEYLCI